MKLNRSARETIRAYCLHCTGGNKKEVDSCDGDDPAFHQCAFHPYRTGRKRAAVKVMRQFCLQCMGDSAVMIRECDTTDCLIHPFRFGKIPSRTGKGRSAEQMALIRPRNRAMSKSFSDKFQRTAIG